MSWRKATSHEDNETQEFSASPQRGSSLPTSPGRQASEAGFSTSQECHMSSITTLEALMSQRHLEWERQAASADQRQIELFHSQCALLREQIGVLSRSLMTVKGEVQGLQRSESQVLARLEAEVAQRQELSRRVESEVIQRLELSSRFAATCNDLHDNVHELSGNLTDTCEKLTAKSYALRETEEASFAEQETLKAEFRELQQEASQASDTRILEVSQVSDARISELAAALEGEKSGRGAAVDELSAALKSLRFELEREGEPDRCVRREAHEGSHSVEEEKAIMQHMDDLRHVLSQEVNEHAMVMQQLRTNSDDFRCNLDKLQIGSDESSTALHHMSARLEAERRERVSFVAKMPDQFAALSQALGTNVKTLLEEVTDRLERRCTTLGQEFAQERLERKQENAGLRRILHGLEERVQALVALAQLPSSLR